MNVFYIVTLDKKRAMVLVVWDNWGEHVCRQLSNFLVGAAHTDLTISVGAMKIKTHRIILSFFSPFFKKMLDDVSEERPVVVVFPEINFRALQIIIAYMYQGQVNVPAEILPHVTELAKILKVKGLVKLPNYLDSVITEEVKVADEQEDFDDGIEDHIDFASETEGIVELEVTTADCESSAEPTALTAVTVITDDVTSCFSPKKVLHSPLHANEEHISVSQSSMTSSMSIEKSEVENDRCGHILIESEDAGIQLSGVDELTPTHIVKLSEDGSMDEVLFNADYIQEDMPSDDHSIPKEPTCLVEEHKQSSRKRRESLYKLTKYGPDDLVRALEDLRKSNGTLREIAERWGVPRSTLSVSARIAGISPLQKNVEYDTNAVEEAKQAVRAGSSYMKAAKQYNIPKSVLWRKCQRDGIFRRESQRYYNYGRDDLAQARQMLLTGQSLIDTVKETKIPKTTVFRLKEQLVREGKMPASCISRIFRPRKPSECSLQQAVVACKEEGMSLSQASEKLQVAKTTVWRRLKRLKEQDSENSSLDESHVYEVRKKNIKIENTEHVDVDDEDLRFVEKKRYSCYGNMDNTLQKKDHCISKTNIEIRTLDSPLDSTESQTVIMENGESFLASEGTVIHAGSPLSIKQETGLTETGGAAVVTAENSANSHFQLEMPLVNFPGGGYQVVGSEIVIGGQHVVVLDSSESSQHPHSNADRHIVVTPFPEMEVTNESESSVVHPGSISPTANHMEPHNHSSLGPLSRSPSQDITACLHSIKSEPNTSNHQQKTVSEDRMTELITDFMAVD